MLVDPKGLVHYQSSMHTTWAVCEWAAHEVFWPYGILRPRRASRARLVTCLACLTCGEV